jgi:hypothetical protein
MKNKVAKALRIKAYVNMQGGQNGSPKKEYKRLKKVYKALKGEI